MKRKENESFEEYKKRREEEKERIEKKLAGKLVTPMPASQRRRKRIMEAQFNSMKKQYGERGAIKKFMEENMGVGKSEEE